MPIGEICPLDSLSYPLHLFSALPELVGFGRGAYQQRSEHTSRMLRQLFQRYEGEDLIMPYTWVDFERDYIKEHFPELTPEERRTILESLPLEERLAGLSAEQIQQYLKRLTSGHSSQPRNQRRKKQR